MCIDASRGASEFRYPPRRSAVEDRVRTHLEESHQPPVAADASLVLASFGEFSASARDEDETNNYGAVLLWSERKKDWEFFVREGGRACVVTTLSLLFNGEISPFSALRFPQNSGPQLRMKSPLEWQDRDGCDPVMPWIWGK